MRQFFYGRVSKTVEYMTTENQKQAFINKGFNVDRFISEYISGTTKAMNRPEFKNLVDNKLEAGDELHILRLDRLGRNVIDVLEVVELLKSKGIKLILHDLASFDITTPQGALMLHLVSAVAQFERDLIRERTLEGLARANSEGRHGGRPKGSKHAKDVYKLKDEGWNNTQIARRLGITPRTVAKVLKQRK